MNSTPHSNGFPDSGTPPDDPGAQRPDPTEQAWRRRARLTVLWSAVVGLALLSAAVVVA